MKNCMVLVRVSRRIEEKRESSLQTQARQIREYARNNQALILSIAWSQPEHGLNDRHGLECTGGDQ